MQDAKDTADSAIRDLMKKENRGDIRSMERNRTKLREKIDNTNSKVSINSSTVKKKKNKPSDFKLGEDVRIISLNMEGTVNSLPDSKGNLYVLCGIMRMQAKRKQKRAVMQAPIKSCFLGAPFFKERRTTKIILLLSQTATGKGTLL